MMYIRMIYAYIMYVYVYMMYIFKNVYEYDVNLYDVSVYDVRICAVNDACVYDVCICDDLNTPSEPKLTCSHCFILLSECNFNMSFISHNKILYFVYTGNRRLSNP